MAKLAIKGHETRGKEVIEILEMLGGNVDKKMLSAASIGDILNPHVYFFDHDSSDNRIAWYYLLGLEADGRASEMMIFTLEEFEEKFPYKVGDKVCYQPNLQIDAICVSEIISMKWVDNSVIYFTSNGHSLYACDLQPYKEETMEDKGTLEQIDITRELRIADEVEVILGDYEFVLKDGKTYFVKKKPQYPKTYEECCNILGIEDRENGYCGYEYELLGEFQKLYICRNAYWKMAGEQMGLGKPWEPDWGENDGGYRYCIRNQSNKIVLSNEWLGENYILSFPTKEMRDAFYEYFKELIEECKELL